MAKMTGGEALAQTLKAAGAEIVNNQNGRPKALTPGEPWSPQPSAPATMMRQAILPLEEITMPLGQRYRYTIEQD